MSQRVTSSIDSYTFVQAKLLKSLGKMLTPLNCFISTVVTKNTRLKYQSRQVQVLIIQKVQVFWRMTEGQTRKNICPLRSRGE
jgi:hypothetical protein